MAKTSSSTVVALPSLWLQLYFVFASLLGLLLIVMGAFNAVNVGLTATVLKPAPDQFSRPMPPEPTFVTEKAAQDAELTEDQKAAVAAWEKEFQAWQESQKNFDYEAENRKRSMAFSIAMLVTGIPVFALHAPWVFKRAAR